MTMSNATEHPTDHELTESEFATWITERQCDDWTMRAYWLAGVHGAVDFTMYQRPLSREATAFLLGLMPGIVTRPGLLSPEDRTCAIQNRPDIGDKLAWTHYLDGALVECIGERVGWHAPRPWSAGQPYSEGGKCDALRGVLAGSRCYYHGNYDAGVLELEHLAHGVPALWEALRAQYQEAFRPAPQDR
jgi:hypothetical protein